MMKSLRNIDIYEAVETHEIENVDISLDVWQKHEWRRIRFTKISRRLKIVDFQVFIFAYNHCCFVIIYLFWRVQEGKNLIPTVVLKEKSTSAIRRREGSILRAREGAKSQISRVRKKLYFRCEFQEFDAFKVSNLSISVDFQVVL